MTKTMNQAIEKPKEESPEIEDDGFEFPEDGDITEMLDEIPLDTDLKNVTDRYFTSYYRVDVQKPNDDICIRLHSNRICMLTLAPSHPVLDTNCEIEKINFKVTEKLDRTANKLSGKGKHGAQALQESSNICIISCSNGETWPIKCCMSGKLIEVNEALLNDPNLIKELPHKGGYLAIILPNIKVYEEMKKNLLSEKDYNEILSVRQNNKQLSFGEDVKNHNSVKRPSETDCFPTREEKIPKV